MITDFQDVFTTSILKNVKDNYTGNFALQFDEQLVSKILKVEDMAAQRETEVGIVGLPPMEKNADTEPMPAYDLSEGYSVNFDADGHRIAHLISQKALDEAKSGGDLAIENLGKKIETYLLNSSFQKMNQDAADFISGNGAGNWVGGVGPDSQYAFSNTHRASPLALLTYDNLGSGAVTQSILLSQIAAIQMQTGPRDEKLDIGKEEDLMIIYRPDNTALEDILTAGTQMATAPAITNRVRFLWDNKVKTSRLSTPTQYAILDKKHHGFKFKFGIGGRPVIEMKSFAPNVWTFWVRCTYVIGYSHSLGTYFSTGA